MTLAAGRLRHRVLIEALENVLDSNGEAIQNQDTGEVLRAWVPVQEVWAAIEPLSAREFIQSQAMQSKISAKIIIRQRPGLDASMRLVHMFNGERGPVYNPEGFLADKESGLEYLTIPVSAGVSQDGQ